ncbi:hypothetical protein ACA910_013477 [Epithemia clementina (nom. ined.)]
MLGIKNQDLFATDPESGDLVSAKKVQSSSNVWPVDIILGHESSSLMQNHLKKLFQELEKCAFEGVVEEFDWMPIRLSTNAEMSAVWKMNQFGGAMNNRDHPCHCCGIENDNIATPNDDKDECRWCCLLGYDKDKSKKCFHYKMLTEDVLKSMEEDLANLESVFQEMIEEIGTIRERSQILCTENPRVAKKSSKNNSSSIHFALTNHTPGSIHSEYNEKITNDLELRGMDAMSGTLKEQQSRLRVRLIEEWSYVKLKQSVKLGQERSAKAMFVLLNTVPCILNAENRMGIKITETLLIEGLSNAMKEAK